MKTLSKKPDGSIAAVSKNKAEAKAIYRLLGDENLTNEVILSSHRKQTIKEIKYCSSILQALNSLILATKWVKHSPLRWGMNCCPLRNTLTYDTIRIYLVV